MGSNKLPAHPTETTLTRAFFYGLSSAGLLLLAGFLAFGAVASNLKELSMAAGLLCMLASIGTALASIVTGIVDWKEYGTDLAKGRSLVGMILGASSLAMMIVAMAFPFSNGHVSFTKDAIINDLNNLAAHAYQYRIRPESMKGGSGSYVNYKIPSKLASNENARYESRVVHPDTIVYFARATYQPGNGMTVALGPDGRLIQDSWQFWGDYD